MRFLCDAAVIVGAISFAFFVLANLPSSREEPSGARPSLREARAPQSVSTFELIAMGFRHGAPRKWD